MGKYFNAGKQYFKKQLETKTQVLPGEIDNFFDRLYLFNQGGA